MKNVIVCGGPVAGSETAHGMKDSKMSFLTDSMRGFAQLYPMLRLIEVAFCWGWLAFVPTGSANGQVGKSGDCLVDREILTLPKCALEMRDGKFYVSKRYLPLFFSAGAAKPAEASPKSRNLAWTHLPEGGWAYFNRSGLIVIQNVATMDNGPSDFHHGLVRIEKGNKWGLSNFTGKLIVPLKYDGILDYEEGKGWLACSGCHTEAERGGEYRFFAGGKWMWLDRHGNVSGIASDPSPSGSQRAQH